MPKNVEPLNSGTKDLPVNWHWATIGDTGDFINGFAFKPLHRFGPTPRAQFEELLFSMLPAVLGNEKKRNKVKNLLTEMRMRDKSVRCQITNGTSLWELRNSGV